MVTTLRNGENVLIGYADVGLKQSFPNLAWTVLVVQDTREAFAATRSVMRLILFAVGVCLAMVTLLGVYFMLSPRKRLHGSERARARRESSRGNLIARSAADSRRLLITAQSPPCLHALPEAHAQTCRPLCPLLRSCRLPL